MVDQESREVLLSMEELATTAFYSLDRSVHITAEPPATVRTIPLPPEPALWRWRWICRWVRLKVTNIINVHDSGVLINPKLAEAQVHGGMSMGLGYGLSEQLLFDAKGRPLNDNLLDYKLPTAMDTPDLHVEFVEINDPQGPSATRRWASRLRFRWRRPSATRC